MKRGKPHSQRAEFLRKVLDAFDGGDASMMADVVNTSMGTNIRGG
jgi:hypothetical protein